MILKGSRPNKCPVPPSLIKFISVMRIFRVPSKVENKFIIKKGKC